MSAPRLEFIDMPQSCVPGWGPQLGAWEEGERDTYLPTRLLNFYREERGPMEPTCPVAHLSR